MISMDVEGKKKIFELCDIYYIPDMGQNNLLLVSYIVKINLVPGPELSQLPPKSAMTKRTQ